MTKEKADLTGAQTFYQRHLLAEALCGHSLWRDIQHAAGELPGPVVFVAVVVASPKLLDENPSGPKHVKALNPFAALMERAEVHE